MLVKLQTGKTYRKRNNREQPNINMSSKIRKYVKKPIPIEAEQLKNATTIKTLEGTIQGRKGDYLVTGIRGEKYIVKQDIFEEMYVLF